MKTTHHTITRLALLAALTCAAAATAATENSERPTVKLRGFGTLGAVHSSEKNADFISGYFEPNGAGHTRDWAFGVDSKVGVQLDVQLTERLSGVLQLVAQHRYDNTYTPQVEWANLKYQVTPELDVRVGRTVAMPFMVSDSRLVGYANPWLRPPQELYGLVPLTNKDGVDATYRLQAGPVTHTLHASYGFTNVRFPAGKVRARDYFDIAHTVEYGGAAVRASYSQGRVDVSSRDFDPLLSAMASFGNTLSAFPFFARAGAEALALAERYRFDDTPISVLALGASYDRDRWLLMTEWARFNGHSILSDSVAWYATAGYRVGALTPYATLARLRANRPSEAGIPAAGLPPPLAGGAAALNAGLNSLLATTARSQRSVSAGVRWDFRRNAALKVQYDRIDLDEGSNGRLANLQRNFQPGGRLHVLGVGLDFVF